MPTIDNLDIQIKSSADDAVRSIDKLVNQLSVLSLSLGKINSGGLIGLANGVERLGRGMQSMKNVGTADFTRLTKNINSLSQINTQNLNLASGALSQMTRAFNSMGAVSQNAQQVGVLASNLSKLGYKSITTATQNIPKLATSLNNLMVVLSRSPQVSRNVIDMTNALANLAQQGSGVGNASSSLVNGLNRTNSAMDRSTKKARSLATAFGKLYANYFLIIRGFKALWSSIESTADYMEAFNYFNVAFDKIAGEWSQDYERYGYENAEVYAESFTERLNDSFKKMSGIQIEEGILSETGMKNLGLNIQEITQFSAQLASVSNSMGLTGEASLATASSMTKLAGDVASLFNQEYQDVSDDIQSVLIGQSRAGYKYGWDTTVAGLTKTAEAFDISKPLAQMSQAEKMQLRLLTVLDQSRVSWGDLARTIESPANQLRILKTNLSETGIVLGQLFVPLVQQALPVINGMTIAIKRLLTNIAGMLGIELDVENFSTGISGVGDALADMEVDLGGATEAAEEWKNQLLGFDEINKLNESTDVDLTSGVTAGEIDLTDEILKATEEYEKYWNEAYEKMENKAEEWADVFSKALEPVSEIFQNFMVGDFELAGENVGKLATSIMDWFSEELDEVEWEEIGNDIGDFLSGLPWYEIIKSAFTLTFDIWEAIADAWFGSFEAAPIETSIITAIGLLKFTNLGSLLATKLGGFTLGKFTFSTLGSNLATGIVGGLVAGLAGFKLGNVIYEWITGEEFDLSVTETFKEIWGSIVDDSWLEAIMMMFEDLRSGLEDLMDHFDIIPDWLKPKGVENTTAYAAAQTLIDKYSSIGGSVGGGRAEDFSRGELKLERLITVLGEDTVKNLLGTGIVEPDDIEKMFEEKFDFYDAIEDSLEDGNDKLTKIIKHFGQEQYDAWVNASVPFDVIEAKYDDWLSAGIGERLNGVDSVTSAGQAIIDTFKNASKTAKSEISGINTTANSAFSYKMWTHPGINEGIRTSMINAANSANTYGMDEILSSAKNTFATGKWVFGSAISGITSTFQSMYNNANTYGITKTYNKASSLFTKDNFTFAGVAEGLKTSFSTGFKGVKSVYNNFADAFNKMFQLDLSSLGKTVLGSVGTAALSIIPLGTLPKFATGGFPEDGLFMANHNELIGGFSNGKTAVANNDQITQGIAQAVAPAVYDAVVSAMRDTSTGTGGDVVVMIDGKQVFKAVKRQADKYTTQTGKSAFII